MPGLTIFRNGKTSKRLGLVFIIAVRFLTSFEQSAHADSGDLRFCVVPVKDGFPTAADVGEAWRITNVSFRIPGLPSLVFTPQNRGGQWTIDAGRRLVPYTGPFPHTFFDRGRWVVEPWSSRVVAATMSGGISFLKPGGTGFEELEHGRPGPVLGVYLLPRRHLTVVTSSKRGPLIAGERELTPWLSAEEMSAHNVHGIYSIHDAPSLSAAIVLDLEGNVHVLTDDDQWFQVGTLSRDDHGMVFDAPGSKGALYRAGSSVLFINKVDDGLGRHFRADVLRSTPSFGAGQVFPVAKLFGQVLTFSSDGWFGFRKRWRRLTPSGFEDIAGGDIGLPDPQTFPYGSIDDLTTIGRTLIEGRDGLFLYDAEKITPVVGGERRIIGERPQVYDLPSIGRVVVATRNGMFELTKAGTLVALSMPFPADGLPLPDVTDWPESGVALVSTRAGLFTIDSDLKATPVLGGDTVGFGGLKPATGVNPATGEMVLTGSRALFLAVDAERSHDGTCRQAQKLANQTPDSSICLRPVHAANAASIGDVIGEMIAAPGDHGVLLDSVRGLFQLDADDKITQLESRGEMGDRFTRSLARLPWSDQVIAAGTVETIVRNDMTVQLVARSQHSDLLDVFPSIRSAAVVADFARGPILLIRLDGDQYRRVDTALTRADVDFIVDAPWFGGPLVETRRGLFLLNRDGQLTAFELRNLDARPPGLFKTVAFVIDRFRTVYVWRDGWFRITQSRQLLPVHGMPQHTLLNASLDPGSGSVLLATSAGLFAMDQDGNASHLGAGSPADHAHFGSLARTSDDRVILAGGTEGLFRIDLDNYELQQVPNGSKDIIGAVRDITSSHYAGLDIVDAANGTYSLSDKGLELIHDLSAASNASRVFVFEQQHRMLVTKRGYSRPVLYEIGRRNSGGTCQRQPN
jgi:hypothetical protein